MKVRIDDLPVRVKQLDPNEMSRIFGGALYSTSSLNYRVTVEPGCGLCMGGLTGLRPEGGGDWSSATNEDLTNSIWGG